MNRRDFCFSTAAATAALLGHRAFAASPAGGNPQLTVLFDRFFATSLAESPELATSLGIDTGAHAAAKTMLSDVSLAAVARRKRINSDQIAALQAIDRSRLSGQAMVDYDTILYDRVAYDRAARRFAYGGEGGGTPYLISQIDGAYSDVPQFLDAQHTIATAADCDAYLSRMEAFGRMMDQECERVRHDVALGVVPPDFALAGALAQMRLLRVPADRSTLVSSLVARARAHSIPGDWAGRAAAIYNRAVLPALDRQIALVQQLQPHAVHDAGVWRLPDGEAYYTEALRSSTTSDMAPAEVHRLGLDVTRELTARAEVLFRRIGMTSGTVAERYAALYRDPRYLYPDSEAGRAQELAALTGLVQAMERRLPSYFGTLPRAPLEIRRIPPETEGGASTHYSGGSLDGTRPGIYWLNMRDMGEVPYWDMPTTTFHEGVPGHHLQIMLQLQSSLPDARKILGFSGYAEGWALYAEQLAQEMGFYTDQPAWELGYIHDALLRSGRLVVDTGIHAMRWSREQAVTTLHEIDGDPLSLCGQEIERYACNPGQACSYMVGKTTILRLRERARQALGSRFDIRHFHDAVLLSGSMPLTVLENRIDSYIADARHPSA